MGEPRDPLRRVARYRVDRLVAEDEAAAAAGTPGRPPSPRPSGADDDAADRAAAGRRPSTAAARASLAEELVRQAMARGEFDDLPLAGKPIPGLTGRHDPDWWLKAFIEREGITGVLPEALQLRKDDAALDDTLDGEHTEERVREVVGEFNARIVEARRQLLGGPPVVTPLRDVDAEVVRWRERRRARRGGSDARAGDAAAPSPRGIPDRADGAGRARRWWPPAALRRTSSGR